MQPRLMNGVPLATIAKNVMPVVAVADRFGKLVQGHLYSATTFQSVMTFGQTPHSDAICSAMGRGGSPAPAPAAASCNALLKAAGKC